LGFSEITKKNGKFLLRNSLIIKVLFRKKVKHLKQPNKSSINLLKKRMLQISPLDKGEVKREQKRGKYTPKCP